MAVYQPSTATWFIRMPDGGTQVRHYGGTGLNNYIPVPGAYIQGIGQTQLAVFSYSAGQPNGVWSIQLPDGGTETIPFGATGLTDVPVEATAGALTALGLIPTNPSVIVAQNRVVSGTIRVSSSTAEVVPIPNVPTGAAVVGGPLASSSGRPASTTPVTSSTQGPAVANLPVAQAISMSRRGSIFSGL
jgi:hypothetical protein